jgi:sugar lactone lactonase YvrE
MKMCVPTRFAVRSRSAMQAWVALACVACASHPGQKPPSAPQPEQPSEVVEVQKPAVPLALAPAPPPGSAEEEVVTKAPALLVKDAFAAPESVLYDPAADVYLVSNLNGSPSEADDNGFISRVSPEGKVVALKWIDGATDEVELHAPKGMAIFGDLLYVADLDRIRKFNVHTGAALGAIAVSGASNLNGVSAAPDGTLYFTDLGARMVDDKLEPTGQDAVYKLVREQARAVLRGKQLNQPNGVWADASGVWVVTFASNELFDVKSGSKAKVQKLPAGALDGIVKANDGRFYVSSLETSQVYAVEPGGGFEIAYDVRSPADLGYDSKRNWLLIPLMLDNSIKLQPL